ncbi:MAG: endopeptidase La [Proteobacteria bacterium]|nr:endopeptidase La [Pseudomonadota bacterium]
MSDNILDDLLESVKNAIPDDLPEKLFIFPLTESVIFPDVMMPIVVTPGPMLELVKRAKTHSDYLGFLWGEGDDPTKLTADKLAKVGCVGRIIRMGRMPDGSFTMLIHSISRMRAVSFLKSDRLIAEVEYLEDEYVENDDTKAYCRNIQTALSKLSEMDQANMPRELLTSMTAIDDPSKIADMIASHFDVPNAKRQEILAELNVQKRLEAAYEILVKELDLAALGQKIHDTIRERIEASQREFFLREQLRAIRKELGDEKDEIALSVQNYKERIAASGMSEEAEAKAQEELKRLSVLTPESSETNIIRTYLDWLCDLPWNKTTEDVLDLKYAEKVLEQDHFGLDDIKQRILEFLAVRKLKPDHQGQIICFLGPPGVGKTSLARSINRALKRKFFGFSLGGLKDEAEIRGHRRTYVGAMPGKILQGLKRVGVRNPVFVLDEIDKLGSDWHGDPSSAMLEVLDPSQNMAFNDHYLDVSFDLSDVMFIATANDASTIPRPLLDRMEIIELSGYIDEEKFQIARRHIVPKEIAEHGMTPEQMQFTPTGLKKVIRSYTREAGVRELERMIAKVCRKNARRIAGGEEPVSKINQDNISDFLGSPIYTDEVISRGLQPGVAVGLAWTQFGGEILFIETTKMPGVGQLKLTGQLGEVMSESVQIAFSFIRANMGLLHVTEDMFPKYDFHVHFPAGAIPKDGPSAGITITTSILSLLLGQPIPERLAMTGEITLTGNVLPVGGIKEKVIAAKRAGARTLVMCSKNRRDVDELAAHIKEELTFFFVDHYKDVFNFVFKKRCVLDLANLPKNVLYTPKSSVKNAALQAGTEDAEVVKPNDSAETKAKTKKRN